MRNKIKLIVFTILIPAIPLEIVFIANIFLGPSYYLFHTYMEVLTPYMVGVSAILCGIFVGIKLNDNIFGKIAYAIMTSIIASIIFSMLAYLPLFILLSATFG